MPIITRERVLSSEDAAINEGFSEYNQGKGQESVRRTIALACYSAEGEFLAALDGYVFFDWLTISRLWVAPAVRGHGKGTELMREAERIAGEMSCVGSTLSTYDFQARPFYEKLGYEVFGVLGDNPRGRERFFMRKTL